MFEIGDLVRFRTEGVVTILRNNPTKEIGIVINIIREAYHCYSGDMDDRITVIWLGSEIEETMPEFYLKKVDEDT
jgi:hypothetical protein|tara:strand:+ start:743 stop:967 length:225 start_codon:yes stop_codon:yes gene_type:complete